MEEKFEYEYRTTRSLVYRLLRDEPRCRGDDTWLVFRAYEEIAKSYGKSVFIPFELFKELPSPETVSRCRRKWQEQGKFLPDANTMIERERKREFVKKWSQKNEQAND